MEYKSSNLNSVKKYEQENAVEYKSSNLNSVKKINKKILKNIN